MSTRSRVCVLQTHALTRDVQARFPCTNIERAGASLSANSSVIHPLLHRLLQVRRMRIDGYREVDELRSPRVDRANPRLVATRGEKGVDGSRAVLRDVGMVGPRGGRVVA